MSLILNDLSEHQGRIDWEAHRSARQAVILRAHNGNRADTRFLENRAGAAPLHAVGIYQYLVFGRDAAAQARDFVATVGELAPNEWPILDIEEGSVFGARAAAWLAVVEKALGRRAWVYSGDNRWQTTDLATAVGDRHRWVARYSDTHQPVTAWTLWQRASDAHAPGVATLVDENYFPGDIDSFVTLAIGADDDMQANELGPALNKELGGPAGMDLWHKFVRMAAEGVLAALADPRARASLLAALDPAAFAVKVVAALPKGVASGLAEADVEHAVRVVLADAGKEG